MTAAKHFRPARLKRLKGVELEGIHQDLLAGEIPHHRAFSAKAHPQLSEKTAESCGQSWSIIRMIYRLSVMSPAQNQMVEPWEMLNFSYLSYTWTCWMICGGMFLFLPHCLWWRRSQTASLEGTRDAGKRIKQGDNGSWKPAVGLPPKFPSTLW